MQKHNIYDCLQVVVSPGLEAWLDSRDPDLEDRDERALDQIVAFLDRDDLTRFDLATLRERPRPAGARAVIEPFGPLSASNPGELLVLRMPSDFCALLCLHPAPATAGERQKLEILELLPWAEVAAAVERHRTE